ncbi:nucleosidase [Jongsikchunia kroppenstedtii]|uniref:nucleosidase n=1 Tax=Jongsikchunia kroppenstedtii TaxID=1121721 RepID=UPI00035DA4B8|nr:nucleosidase [Jongsikchunia kroppenstedtii]
MSRYLVVAATAAESAHVPDGFEVLITGIGKVAATAALTRRLAAEVDVDGLEIINLGTAGALRDGLTGLFEVGSVLNHEISADALRTLGYDARELLVVGDTDTALATGDVFVTDPAVRDRLAERAHLVDMEGYAIAYVAGEFGVPVRLIKHVSDAADAGAMEWVSVVDASARVLGDWVAQNLRRSG